MNIICISIVLLLSFISIHSVDIKGMTFVGDRYCPQVDFGSPEALLSLQKLRNTGANYIALVITEFQNYTNSTEIYPIYKDFIKNDYYIHKTETIESITKIVKEAHRLGFKVMMKPHIDLSKELRYYSIWRGNIGGFRSEADWKKWFASYEKMLLKYAKLSEELNVEMLCISTELISANHKENYWRDLIKEVRKVYHGLLTDAANHSGEEVSKRWWDAVDYIGVDAYYMGGSMKNNAKNLDSRINDIANKLELLHKKWKKDVLITEYGFCSGECGIGRRNIIPSVFDHYLQAYFYERSFQIFSKKPFIKGIFWWTWTSDPYVAGLKDHCLTPQNKMSEYILYLYYGGNMENFTYKVEGQAKCLCTI